MLLIHSPPAHWDFWTSQLNRCSTVSKFFLPGHLWFLRCDTKLNFFSHLLQLTGFSPVWIMLCCFRFPFSRNFLPQSVQVKGFSPVWTLRCLPRAPLSLYLFLHMEQLKGFSPVWVLICATRVPLWEKFFPQTKQLKGFSPVCVRLCLSKLPFCLNFLPHSTHSYGISPVWQLMCFRTLFLCLNVLLHTGHLQSFLLLWELLWDTASLSFPESENRCHSNTSVSLVKHLEKENWPLLAPFAKTGTSKSEADSDPRQPSPRASASICSPELLAGG